MDAAAEDGAVDAAVDGGEDAVAAGVGEAGASAAAVDDARTALAASGAWTGASAGALAAWDGHSGRLDTGGAVGNPTRDPEEYTIS